jgi:hypothetical protein
VCNGSGLPGERVDILGCIELTPLSRGIVQTSAHNRISDVVGETAGQGIVSTSRRAAPTRMPVC